MFGKPSRNHITIIFEQIGAVGFVLITGALSLAYEFSGGMGNGLRLSYIIRRIRLGETELLVFAAVVSFCAVLMLWLIRRWYKTVFYIDGEYLVVERNTLMRKMSRLPLLSISTVNLERSLFERVVGTAKIKLDINSSVTANHTDFTFVLPLEDAKAFESALLAGKSSGRVEPDSVLREKVCSFTVFQALRDALLGQLHYPLMLAAVMFFMQSVSGRTDYNRVQLLSTVGALLLSWVGTFAVRFFSSCGFIMEKDDNGFYISSGLLRKKQYSFEKNKVNALIVHQPLFARMFGYYRAEVAVVGLGNDKNETPQICLLVKKQELERILSVCAPDFKCSGEILHSHKVGLAAALIKYGFASAVLAAALLNVSAMLSAAVMAAGVLLAVLSFHSKTLSADNNVFAYSKGVLSRSYASFKYSAVQTAQLRTNALFRRVNAGRIRISILSASAVSVHTTGWFGKDNYELLTDKIGC